MIFLLLLDDVKLLTFSKIHEQSGAGKGNSGTDQSVYGLGMLLLYLGYKVYVLFITITLKSMNLSKTVLSMLIYT